MMKKLMRLSSAALLLAVSAVCAAESSGNLIRNPQFLETKNKNPEIPDGKIPDPWYVRGGIKKLPEGCGVSTTEKPAGYKGNSYKVAGAVILNQTTLPVTPGKSYNVSCMMKTENMPWKAQARLQIIWLNKGWGECMLEYTDKTGAKKKMWNHQWVWTGGNTDWKKFEISGFTAPADAKYARICIGFANQYAGTAYYADLKMVECAKPDPFVNRVTAIPFGKSFDDAVTVDDFTIPGALVKSAHPTTVKLYFDDEALHLRANCHQQSVGGEQFMESVKKNNDDNVEFLFLPPGEKEQFHLLAAPSGWSLGLIEEWSDKKWPFDKRNWNVSKFGTKVEVKENDWIVTTRIPFSAMGRKSAPKDGEEWRVSFCRNVQTRGKELSAWAKHDSPFFQRTDSFGKGIFRRSGLVADSPKVGVDSVTVSVRNLSEKPAALQISRVEQDDKGGFVAAASREIIPAKSRKNVQFESKGNAKKMMWAELRDGSHLIAKHYALADSVHISLGFLDPEKVRTQTVYLATDMPFFIAWSMWHTLPSKHPDKVIQRYKKPVDFVMEVPAEGLNFRGVMHDFSAYRWTQSPLIPPKVKEVTVNGKKFKQFRFELPLIANHNAAQFLFFYDCSMKPGVEFTGRAWFIMDGKPICETVKTFKTVKVGKVKKTFTRMPFNIGLMDPVTLYNWFPKDPLSGYYSLGFNCLSIPIRKMLRKEFYQGTNPKTYEDYYDLMYQDFLKEKRPFFLSNVSVTAGAEAHAWTFRDEPGTVGIKKDGTKCTSGGYMGRPALCFNYRGPLYKKWVDGLVNSSAFAKYRITWLSLDMETWRPPAWDEICYCETCRREWVKYCKSIGREDLAKVDPRKGSGKDFTKVWKEFQAESAAGLAGGAVQAVKASVKGAKSTSPWGGFTSQEYGSVKVVKNKKNQHNFFEHSLYFTPEGNYEKLKESVKSKDPNRIATSPSFGQTPGCPDWQVTPEHVKETLFETMIFGTKQTVFFYYIFMEPLRMSKLVEALNAVTPFEDIILEGRLSPDVKASDPKMLLTRRALGAESLLAVRAYYSAKPVTAEISFPKVASELTVYDCETGKIVGKLTPENPSFTYTIGAKRCRMLYVGTAEQWKKRHE